MNNTGAFHFLIKGWPFTFDGDAPEPPTPTFDPLGTRTDDAEQGGVRTRGDDPLYQRTMTDDPIAARAVIPEDGPPQRPKGSEDDSLRGGRGEEPVCYRSRPTEE